MLSVRDYVGIAWYRELSIGSRLRGSDGFSVRGVKSVYRLVRKNRIISRLASGPLPSV